MAFCVKCGMTLVVIDTIPGGILAKAHDCKPRKIPLRDWLQTQEREELQHVMRNEPTTAISLAAAFSLKAKGLILRDKKGWIVNWNQVKTGRPI